MSKALLHFPIVTILLIALSLAPEESACASGDPSSWGELSGGLRLRASVDSSVVRGDIIAFNIELLVAHDSSLKATRLTTVMDGAWVTLHIFEEATGKSRRFRTNSRRECSPNIDIALDSISDSSQVGTVKRNPFSNDWPAGDHAWGKLELFVPSAEDERWSGLLTSAPFELTIVEPNVDMEEFTFVVPTRLTLVEGPRISFDSASVDTIAVLSRRGYHRVETTRSSRSLRASVIATKTNDKGEKELPFLPHLLMVRPIPGTGLFVDGETTKEFRVDLYEAQDMPEFHHGIHFSNPYRTLWQRTFRLTISKDELLALTPSGEDQIDYRTCLVPHRVRLEGDKRLSFRKGDALPHEFQVKKGSAIGYSVLVDNQNVGCFEGYPQSPLIKLPKYPSCESPAEITFRLFQYENGEFQGNDDRLCGTSQTLWLSTCTIGRDSGIFDLEVSDDFGTRPWGWRRWRQCQIPRSLTLTTDGRIEFDSTDMQTIDFRPWSGRLPLVRITVDEEPAKLVSTQLCNPIALWHPTDQADTSVEITIDIVLSEPQEIPDAESARVLWSRSYQLSPPAIETILNAGGAE